MNAGRLERAAAHVAGHAGGEAAVANLSEIVRLSAATSAGAHVLVDPSLARGLSYYTGAIMEIAVPDLAGSLGGGGRYDGLIGMFSGEDLPACGFSLGLERILVVMAERSMFPPSVQSAAADVLVTLFDRGGRRATRCGWPATCGARGAARRGLSGSRQAGQAVQVRRRARPPVRDRRRRRRARGRTGDASRTCRPASRPSSPATRRRMRGWPRELTSEP